MMNLKPNTFYIKKAVTTSIPLINEFADLPLSGSSSSNNTFFAGYTTLSTGDVTSFNIVSGNTSSDLNYGDYTLEGGYLRYFTDYADTGDTFDPLSIKLWALQNEYEVEAGGFTLAQSGTTGTAMGHNIAAYYTRPISAIPNMVENFDEREATHTKQIGSSFYTGPYVYLSDFMEAYSQKSFTGKTYKKNAYLKKLAGANYVRDRNGNLIVPLQEVVRSGKPTHYEIVSTARDTDGNTSVIGLASSAGRWAQIFPERVGTKPLGYYGRSNGEQEPAGGITVRYLDVTRAYRGSEEGPEPVLGGIMSTYKLTKNIQNPYSADLSNAFIYSNVQVSSDIGEGGNGNALRIYHEWDYADTNRAVETSELGGSSAISPQVFMMGCYNLPIPLVSDASADRIGDRRSTLPRIDISMNIK